MYSFNCYYCQLEEDNASLERVLNAAHRTLLNMEEGEEEDSNTTKSAENLTGFCNLLANLKPARCNDFLDSLQVMIHTVKPRFTAPLFTANPDLPRLFPFPQTQW